MIEIDQREYFVTAQHVIADMPEEDTVAMSFKGAWVKERVRLVGHHPESDVSVFCLPEGLGLTEKTGPLRIGEEGEVTYSQSVFFLGFPYGLEFGQDRIELRGGFPYPFVKQAIVAGLDKDFLYLDGINNPGFSGGPVVFKNNGEGDFLIGGIIHGYRIDDEDVYDPIGDKK